MDLVLSTTEWYRQTVPLDAPITPPVSSKDVLPITDFKTRGSQIVEQVARTHRPVLVTRRGHGVAVIVALDDFERMRAEIAFGRAVDEGAAQARRGEFASDAEVDAVLRPSRR